MNSGIDEVRAIQEDNGELNSYVRISYANEIML